MSCFQDTCSNCFRETKGVPCVECNKTNCLTVYTTDCVIYNGSDLLCYGIEPGFSLTQVILKLLALIFPVCITTSTTTTT